ncbi:MAG: hypothetical protein EOP48_17065 [Sphingobacteriales bacterium]|nr:MAG: hypothetical protein EOP48_17065 [Sphingobacteriales bacterium]
MYNLKISEEGPPVIIQIYYFGLLTASYVYSLWKKDSNVKIETSQGNNLNSDDDAYQLSGTSQENLGRLIEVFSTLSNPDAETRPEIVALKIFQNQKLLFADELPEGSKVHNDIFSIAETFSVAANSTIANDIFILLR